MVLNHAFVALLMSITFSYGAKAAAEDNVAFSDPTLQVRMRDAEWGQRPLAYGKGLVNVDLSISLDQQQYPYLQPLIQQFAQGRGVTIAVSDGTCGISAGKLRRRLIDMGGFCCPPGALDRLPGLQFHTLGIASLAIIANQDVPVSNITQAQAKSIFNGVLDSWYQVSLKQEDRLAISPIVRPHCSKRPGHWRLIVPHKNDFAENQLKVGSIPDMLNRTSKNEGAIGYEVLWMIEQFKSDVPVKVLSVDGVDPSDHEALAKGLYPFYRTYSVTTWGEDAKPLAKELVSFLRDHINQTPEGKHTLIGTDKLKQYGWKFRQDELISEPNKRLFRNRKG